jgi:adhesin transport system outer membrane protein
MRFKPMARTTTLLTALAAACSGVAAQPADPMREAVAKALAQNPEVSARLNAYRAASEAVTVGRAGWLPRLDLNADVGQDRDRITSRTPENQTLNRTGASLQLSQVLWDGMGTRSEVGRLGHERLARYFELLDTSEQTALEAARAHLDVLRFRRLVVLAEDNYVQHRYAYVQIQKRVSAGVSPLVDLEQANARLALAESNLTTELANLHDVAARYQRIVGEAPPATLPAPTPLTAGVPADGNAAITTAVQRSAAVSASIEGLRAARASATLRDGSYQPRVEARLRAGGGRNYESVLDRTRAATAEIVLNWNLYNGGADQARVRQAASVVTQAADLRDKACRDARQTTAIAFNDTRKLTEQIVLLERNTLSIEKARDAYRQQFDVNRQRSLLDLLNAENEVYTARRSLANAQFDLNVAYVRTHAAMSQLTSQLGLARAETLQEATDWAAGEDGAARCALVALSVPATPRRDLDSRAQELVDRAPPLPPAAAPAPPAAPTPPAPTPPRR